MKIKNHRALGMTLILAGLVLIFGAAVLIGYNFMVDRNAAAGIDEIISQLPDEEIPTVQPDFILNPDMEMPVLTINGVDYIGKITIPKLNLELPVISECTYPNLKIAPCRYSGSVYLDDMVIAGHNYSSLFGSLKNAALGDEVLFTDIDGNVFHYEVSNIAVLRPTDIENMITGDWDLSLFTCTIGGRTRLALRCDRVELYE